MKLLYNTIVDQNKYIGSLNLEYILLFTMQSRDTMKDYLFFLYMLVHQFSEKSNFINDSYIA